ncbi:uncharacterized protein [Typha angustifolia]|uniref:uncharacterized protein isoform X2 n=1 Tax=Typha angustifolia TaxID=59011 RepID=UPI003C2EAAFD
MFFSEALRSKIASWLRPWLQDDPDLELKLGFLKSHGRAKNLSFDPSALNPLIEESTSLIFKSVTVRELDIRVSPWSFPSLVVQLTGLDVILAPRRSRNSKDLAAEDRKRVIESVDPQGALLHELIESLSVRSPGNPLLTVFFNAVLRSCQVRFQDIQFQFQCVNKSHAFILKSNDICLEAKLLCCSSLFRGLMGSLLFSRKKNILGISCSGVEFVLKENDHIDCITSLMSLSISARLDIFRPAAFDIQIPHIHYKLSPKTILLILLMLNTSSSEGLNCVRNGQELWKIAAEKVGHLTLGRKFSLHSIINTVVLWQRYVYAYMLLLLSVGYPSEKILKDNCDRIESNKNLSRCVRHHLKIVSELEEKIPAEAVARARRIARCRTFSQSCSTDQRSSVTLVLDSVLNVFSLISLLWKYVTSIFQSLSWLSSVPRLLGLQQITRKSPGHDLVDVLNPSDTKLHFSFYVGELCITLSSITRYAPTTEALEQGTKLYHLRSPSFCVTMKSLCLISSADSILKSLFISFGQLKVCVSCSPKVSAINNDTRAKRNPSFTAHKPDKGKGITSKIILWSDPASANYLSERHAAESLDSHDSASASFLENNLEELWSNWTTISHRYEEMIPKNIEQPFFLYEFKSSLVDTYLSTCDYSLQHCRLTLGKLNCELGCSTMLLICLLSKQIQQCFHLTEINERKQIPACSSNAAEVPEIRVHDWFDLYSGAVMNVVLKLIPNQILQIGAFIAGPSIRILLQEEQSLYEIEHENIPIIPQISSNSCFVLDLANVEFAMWPASKAFSSALMANSNYDVVDSKCLCLKELPAEDTQEENMNMGYVSRGHITLDACLKFFGLAVLISDLEVNQQSHIVGPMSAEFHLSTCRDYLHSLSASRDALSVALTGSIKNAAIFLCMDELWTFLQVLEDMCLVVSSASTNFDYLSLGSSQDFIRMLMTSDKKDNLVESNINHKTMITENRQVVFEFALNFDPVEIILKGSRKNNDTGLDSDLALSSMSSTCTGVVREDVLNFLKSGIGFYIQNSCIKFSFGRPHIELLVHFFEIRSVIFNSHNQMRTSIDMLQQYKTMAYTPIGNLYEFTISNCKLRFQVGYHSNSVPASACSVSGECSTLYTLGSSHTNDGGSKDASDGPNHGFEAGQSHATSAWSGADCWLLAEIIIGDVFMAEYGLKNSLTGAYEPSNLQISIFVHEDFQTIICKIQGGFIFLETTALAKFVDCCKIYLLLIKSRLLWMLNLSRQLSVKDGKNAYLKEIITKSSDQNGISSVPSASYSEEKIAFQWNFVEDFKVDLSQFSLILSDVNGSGEIQELVLEVDLNLQLLSFGRGVVFDLSRLSLLTKNMQKNMSYKKSYIPVPHFRSMNSVASSSHPGSEEFVHLVRGIANTVVYHDGAHSTTSPTSGVENFMGNTMSKYSSSDSNYILKHLIASIKIERMDFDRGVDLVQLQSNWFGSGSISGFDLSITLSGILTLSTLFAPLLGILNTTTSEKLVQSDDIINEGHLDDDNHKIPDGAIVAIQDLNHHMYMTVEGIDQNYRVVGAIHYSLGGEKSLFKVRHHKGWRSGALWMTFMSLCAKNDEGKAMCLNFMPGSDLVELSCCDDKPHALWKTFPLNHDSDEDASDGVKHFKIVAKNAFHLVNRKNNCGVAFVDGLPEFVKNPGNPFKVKVLNEIPLVNGVEKLYISNNNSQDIGNTNVQEELSYSGRERVESGSSLPHVDINIDRINLTILHKVSDTDYEVPLVRGCINDVHVIMQTFSSKIRIISSFSASSHHFDARRNLWRQIISPISSLFFFRSRFAHQVSVGRYNRKPNHFCCYIKQVDISINELSVDILLYLAGKLNIMGPYAVRESSIFPYSCKIENHSGLNLHCHFPNNHDAIIPGKQSASVFMRHAALNDKLPQSASLVSISLVKQESFSTSPINVSLSDTCIFACRTRVVSLKDSRSFPGPFVVAEVSKQCEEGLSLAISPLLRIHNKSEFSLDLRFRRPHEADEESAYVILQSGDTVDESVGVFDAIDFSGGSKRALMSLALGNFLLSVRPEISEYSEKYGEVVSTNWSEDLAGGKAVRISGVLDKLSYRLRKAFGAESTKSVFSSLHCPVFDEGQHVSDLHFLIHTMGRDVPLMEPPNSSQYPDRFSPVALQMQKEIFIYPTVQVHNLLQSEILVLLTENQLDLSMASECNNIGKQAIISCGSSAYFYTNPSKIYFSVSLISYNSKSKPVNSGDWVKKLHKQKSQVQYLDIELEFCGGKYFASLRLLRTEKGILEVAIFTKYTLKNNTELPLFCTASNQKFQSWWESGNCNTNLPPELGCFLPPRSTSSWFIKSNEVHLRLFDGRTSAAFIDLEALSGFTEISLEAQGDALSGWIAMLGVSLQPCKHALLVPSQVILIVPRYTISNESAEMIVVRQCYAEDDSDGIAIEAKQRVTLQTKKTRKMRRETSLFDSFVRSHRNESEDSHIYIQFCPKETGYNWSGPMCVASLGRFFLKFRGPLGFSDGSSTATLQEKKTTKFASLHIVEEISSLVLHVYQPPNDPLPYRIENCLRGTSIVYFQKESMESDMLGSGDSMEYVWDDLTLPHKLVIQIVDLHLLREISIDKVCSWKPFFKMWQNNGLALDLPLGRGFNSEKRSIDESFGLRALKVGYEVYADGLTRVLRICERPDISKVEKIHQPSANVQFRISYFSVHLLESDKQGAGELPLASTIIVARLAFISIDSVITDPHKYISATVESINVDEKWQGASFGSMLRRNQLHDSGSTMNIISVIFILGSTNSNVKYVKYSSIVLQPIDFKVDEETLMKLVPFWRTSFSVSTQSQQLYFRHFEIHPIKIIASFRPGTPHSTYSSSQEALRSLLHSVVKVPEINNSVVQLNGVLLTHVLVTFRELLLKCAQHYSWYVLRAVYVAKGSPLLPPTIASIFDDTALSSLDVFFDPSDGTLSLPGVTLGMFKFISKSIKFKGSGTRRYFGDLGKTIKTASSKALFAAMTEISDNILRGAEMDGFNGMVNGFHQGILRLAMEPSLLGVAVMEGGPDRKIKLDRSPGLDELYIEGYLQAMLDVMFRQEYLRVRVIDDQVILKNLPPNSTVINEIVENVKSFLMSKALLKGNASINSRSLRHLRSESEWRVGPTVLTLCEHLFVSFAIQLLRKQASKFVASFRLKNKVQGGDKDEVSSKGSQVTPNRLWAVGKFALSGMVAYVDGRLCRHIPNPIARRIVSGFLLSFLDRKDTE